MPTLSSSSLTHSISYPGYYARGDLWHIIRPTPSANSQRSGATPWHWRGTVSVSKYLHVHVGRGRRVVEGPAVDDSVPALDTDWCGPSVRGPSTHFWVCMHVFWFVIGVQCARVITWCQSPQPTALLPAKLLTRIDLQKRKTAWIPALSCICSYYYCYYYYYYFKCFYPR